MIRVDIAKCTGCRSCETACAFYHSGKVGGSISRIKVINIFERGIDGPVVCQACKERYCLSCPDKALKKGKMGQIIFSPSLCSQCKKCETKCPIGAIEVFNDVVYVCDLCGGRPKCVDACTEGAISFVSDTAQVVSLKALRKETSRMNPSERRYHYVLKKGRGQRAEPAGENA
jgi:carbon-monoxide dehydrogenase iron sulfur subunit